MTVAWEGRLSHVKQGLGVGLRYTGILSLSLSLSRDAIHWLVHMASGIELQSTRS